MNSKSILSNWHFSRILRLVLGLIIVVQSIIAKDFALGFIGSLFSIMAIANIGCCAAACSVTYRGNKKQSDKLQNEMYEEVV